MERRKDLDLAFMPVPSLVKQTNAGLFFFFWKVLVGGENEHLALAQAFFESIHASFGKGRFALMACLEIASNGVLESS